MRDRTFVVLLTGLPGSGKTTLAKKLVEGYGGSHINADEVRAAADDWDFSEEGRRRQFERMRSAIDGKKGIVYLDFVCPIDEWRKELNADLVVWMDTIDISRYSDTNKVFEKPSKFDVRISKFDDVSQNIVGFRIRASQEFDHTAPTVQMLGRWQPWHAGHTALFEKAIATTGQVVIMVRTIEDANNPFPSTQVEQNITKALQEEGWFRDRHYIIRHVPNIVDISYGRGVGYTFTEHDLGEEIHQISATAIRKKMGL